MGTSIRNILGELFACLIIFKADIVKRIDGKLRIIILLRFGPIVFRFLLWENPKTSMFMISGFLGPVGNLIYGFEYTKIPNTHDT